MDYFGAINTHEKEFEKYKSFKVNSSLYDEENVTGVQQNMGELTRNEIIYNRLNLKNCSEMEKEFIRRICMNFEYQFYIDGDMLQSTDVIKHHIKLIPNAGIVNVRQYRIPQYHQEPLREIIKDYERQGIIEKCQSNFNSPALIVGKKDNAGGKSDYRFVVDYKKLNQVTEIQNFPIPLIDDIVF